MYRYIIVAGNPFRDYKNTLTFTSLSIIGKSSSKKEVRQIVEEEYDNRSGLIMVIDTKTGKEIEV